MIRQRICKKLDIQDNVGGDYRELAARFGMPNDDIDLISQRTNQTHEVLRWIARNPENTIDKLQDVLLDMGRLDCVRIIEKAPKSGMVDHGCRVYSPAGGSIREICATPSSSSINI